MARQYHFHFYGGPPGSLPSTSPRPPVTVISTPGDARSTRSQSVQSVHPPPRAPLPIQNWPPSRPFRGESEQVDQPVRERPPSHQERHRSRSRRRRRHHRRHDDEPQEAPKPRSAPGILPPRPRPSIGPSTGPTERPAPIFVARI